MDTLKLLYDLCDNKIYKIEKITFENISKIIENAYHTLTSTNYINAQNIIDCLYKLNIKVDIHTDKEQLIGIIHYYNLKNREAYIRYLMYLSKHNYGRFDFTDWGEYSGWTHFDMVSDLIVSKRINNNCYSILYNNNIRVFYSSNFGCYVDATNVNYTLYYIPK